MTLLLGFLQTTSFLAWAIIGFLGGYLIGAMVQNNSFGGGD